MKKCPHCGRTYVDAALNFCLQDGTALHEDTASTFGNEGQMTPGQAPNTAANRSPYSSPANPPATWVAPPYGAQPRKRKSRAWLWILLTFFAFGLIGVVGFFGFLIYLGVKMDEEAKNRNRTLANSSINRVKVNINSNTKTDTAAGVIKEDFSKWQTGTFDYGKVEYKDNGLVVTSKDNDHYCVIHGLDNFLSNDAVSRVTVKNISGGAGDSGFGLVVHANPLVVMLKDYAFLIRTDGKPSYRIVQHSLSKQKELVKWTPSPAINDGTDENELEVRDEGKKLSFYINGTLLDTIDDNNGDAKSVSGIYAGDGIPIAFSELEVERNK
jgi:hypothetical protein